MMNDDVLQPVAAGLAAVLQHDTRHPTVSVSSIIQVLHRTKHVMNKKFLRLIHIYFRVLTMKKMDQPLLYKKIKNMS
jgi:hypothetical protein